MSRNIFNAHKNDDDQNDGAQSACCPQDDENGFVSGKVVIDAGARGCR
ncbi:MAG: hypothetical protein ACR2MW_05785 [Chthoniobacterales bacterium]